MNALRVLALLIYTCGAFAYGALVVVSLREVWGGERVIEPEFESPQSRELAVFGAVLQAVCFAWFVVIALLALLEFGPQRRFWPLQVLQLWLTFAFPPLIMHITYAEVATETCQPPRPTWRALLWPMYVAMHGIAIGSILALAGVIEAPRGLVQRLLNASISGGFILAAVYSMMLVSRARALHETERGQQSKRWHLGLFVLIVLLFGFFISLAGSDTAPVATIFLGLAEIAAKSLPLAFLFVAAYFEHRFEFFDLFVKRGLSLLLTIGVLTGAFALALPLLQPFNTSAAAPWIHAVVLLPVVTALPWLYGRISSTLDRRWLGRRFTTLEAITRFVAALRSATNEAQLVARAEQGLSEIFDAPACVQLMLAQTSHDAPAFPVVQEMTVRPDSVSLGRILMGQRASEAPYFSEDVALLASLADVLASVVDNLRLQVREQEQDQRTRELSLHASRSELKALRAQINPHFLFNALNAIAGLIHKDPAVADRTIEQLADVFRYALRGSESEWALLDDELEFVRAYLEVERARFGSRLHIDVHLDHDVRGARVPTMIVQTLVENAVKHGVALVRGPASVAVHARREHGRLVVTVADSGPGFPDGSYGRTEPARDARGRGDRPKAGGYGLANIRQRLDGYFGQAAALTIERDGDRGRTIVSVSFPFELHGGRYPVAAGTFREPRS